ncbi:hypothetical protein KCP78_15390 [Salmonella enterica subsp. enterica]|nr:hypothetical protein KCP78_15390 [Salmonella enterica subsp. enterica]
MSLKATSRPSLSKVGCSATVRISKIHAGGCRYHAAKDASHVDATARAQISTHARAKTRQLRCSGRRLCQQAIEGHG